MVVWCVVEQLISHGRRRPASVVATVAPPTCQTYRSRRRGRRRRPGLAPAPPKSPRPRRNAAGRRKLTTTRPWTTPTPLVGVATIPPVNPGVGIGRVGDSDVCSGVGNIADASAFIWVNGCSRFRLVANIGAVLCTIVVLMIAARGDRLGCTGVETVPVSRADPRFVQFTSLLATTSRKERSTVFTVNKLAEVVAASDLALSKVELVSFLKARADC